MFVNRPYGVVAATLGVLTLGACDDPTQGTDLRPEGPPDVLSVLVMSDAANHLVESATYCRPNDEKRPGVVGLPDFTTSEVCPADGTAVPELENAYPDGWYVRVMFDELLDPSIESLTEILDSEGAGTGTFEGSIVDSHPVTLQCQSVNGNTLVNVDYDGYYSPAGNSVTWPLGPSLVIIPNDPTLVATNKECQITLNDNITDKDGNPVPADQRGPFKFKIAPISVALIDPSDSGDDTKPTEIDALTLYSDNPFVQFNTEVDIDSLCPDADSPRMGTTPADPGFGLCDSKVFEFSNESGTCDATGNACKTMADCDTAGGDTLCGKGYCNKSGAGCNKDSDCTGTGDTHCDSVYAYDYFSLGADPTHQQYGLGPVNPIPSNTTGEFRFLAGAVLKDRCGSETTLEAGTAKDNTAFKYKTNAFTLNRINIADGETSGAIKKPNIAFNNVLDGASFDAADYTLDPAPANASLSSTTGGDIVLAGNYQPNTPYKLTLKNGAKIADAYGDEYVNEEETVISWKTAPITLGTTTADNATVVKSLPTSNVGVSLSFNQAMDKASFDANTDFTVVNSAGVAQTMTVNPSTSSSANCSPTASSCTITIRANLAPDTYTFTLKKDAALKDVLGNDYTQPADKVIHFTVEDAEPSPAVQCL